MKRMRWDIALIGCVLLLSALLYFVVRPAGEGAWAVVTIAGEEIARYDLAEEQTVTLGEEDYNILHISGGTASVIEANCGDHTCVRTGQVSRNGETIICLPHKLVVEIVGSGNSAFDAVTK